MTASVKFRKNNIWMEQCNGKDHPRTGQESLEGVLQSFFGPRWGWVNATPRPLYPREKRSDTQCTGCWVGPKAGLDRCGKSRHRRDSIPDLPARSELLYRLSFPGPQIKGKGKCHHITSHEGSEVEQRYSFTPSLTSALYRVSQEECARLRESVPYVKVYRYNPKHLYPKLNGYGDNGQRSLKLWQQLHTYWLPNTY